ncbi:proton-coupled zinc antiporter SLC30A2-like isoform X3 [Phymastichus coffea]|uniref:proton-coupled zinc antiporter SLC30A2-like isoform X3 n=1 Tax=Phymastichus coffea TaxID=108790 RepID=UPI00273AB71C|nr:proton-coupled zinc antiporter SLC30A2-like isoform X3 [Phymastichus coffea]
MDGEKIKLFQDKAAFGYGTSLPPNNNDMTDKESASKKVIFCVHGKLSGCCTLVKGGKEECAPIDYLRNPSFYEDHCHRERNEEIDKKARKKLIIASVLCVIFMIMEIVGGVWSNSLAIATDAAHLLTDFASFMISLFSIWVACRPATKKMPFGWYRAEVIGALTSVLLIWVVTGVLFFLAVERVINKDFELDAPVMLITSAIGVAVNLVMGLTLHQHGHGHSHGHSHGHDSHSHDHGHDHGPDKPDKSGIDKCNEEGAAKADFKHKHDKNINVRAAFIHVLGDFIQSAGVFIAAIVIYFKPEWSIVDPICTFLFSILVVLTTVTIIKDVVNVLMEGTPKGFDYSHVENTFMQIDGVVKVHNLRIWALSLDKTALSAHLAIKSGASPQTILRTATRNIHDKYNFFEMTLQIEEFNEKMDNCEQCKPPSQ